jgi:5-methylcytosine-specific restriction endonuclease McrA
MTASLKNINLLFPLYYGMPLGGGYCNIGGSFFMKNKNKLHRFAVYEKCNYSCVFCGLKFDVPDNWDKKSALFQYGFYLEIDHINPISISGDDSIENKQALCRNCNNKKSNKLIYNG